MDFYKENVMTAVASPQSPVDQLIAFASRIYDRAQKKPPKCPTYKKWFDAESRDLKFPFVKLTTEEVRELQAILKAGRDEFIFEPDGGLNFFDLTVWRLPPPPLKKPYKLITVGSFSLSDEMMTEMKIAPGRSLDDGFREWSPFSHTPANEKLLKKYGFRNMPHDVDHYGY